MTIWSWGCIKRRQVAYCANDSSITAHAAARMLSSSCKPTWSKLLVMFSLSSDACAVLGRNEMWNIILNTSILSMPVFAHSYLAFNWRLKNEVLYKISQSMFYKSNNAWHRDLFRLNFLACLESLQSFHLQHVLYLGQELCYQIFALSLSSLEQGSTHGT